MSESSERKYCAICNEINGVVFVRKPDVDLKLCKKCGGVVSILYKDFDFPEKELEGRKESNDTVLD